MAELTKEDVCINRINKRFGKGVIQYGLIEDGDKILVGLSGGKDSLALVNLLEGYGSDNPGSNAHVR
jgi:tRNA(Ile)-lysidine synthase TilS/MesJ